MSGVLEESDRLFASGDDLVDAGQDAEALSRFQAAWSALPDPRDEQEPDIRILGAIADCHFRLGEWQNCSGDSTRAGTSFPSR